MALSYMATVSDHPPVSALVVSLVPLAVIALTVAWNSRRRVLYLLLCIAALGAVVWHVDLLYDHIAWLYFVQHVGAMTLLGITFGRTLTDNHSNALCSRIATGLLRRPLNADYLNYTWKVTLAWTIYFFVSAVLSVLLFFLTPIGMWSLFATILTPFFLGFMFVGEYLIRQRALPGYAHFSIVETIQAYRNSPRP
ncbi:MAG: COG4648 family protein [Sulfuricaulis sp.]